MTGALKITLGSWTLVDQTGSTRCDYEPVSGDQHSWSQSIAEEPCVGAAHVHLYSRGNRRSGLTLTVERTHASPAAALLYKIRHPYAIPADIRTCVITVDGSGTSFQEAAVTSCVVEQSGTVTVSRYALVLSKPG